MSALALVSSNCLVAVDTATKPCLADLFHASFAEAGTNKYASPLSLVVALPNKLPAESLLI